MLQFALYWTREVSTLVFLSTIYHFADHCGTSRTLASCEELITSRVSGRGNRIGAVFLSVCLSLCVCVCVCMCVCVCPRSARSVSIHHNKRTFGQKECTLGDAGGT